MQIAFLNPQGNFDPADRYLAEHPDFGGQLVYVKQTALAMAALGHQVDILTRQITDPDWPEFSAASDVYPDAPGLRIIRLPAGPPHFLRKELLWPYLGSEWVPNILDFYRREGKAPDYFSAHYGDGGISGALLRAETGIPFSFTAHSLGAQKIDKLTSDEKEFLELDQEFFFCRRLMAERIAMNHSLVNITSTSQERYTQYGHPAYQGAVDPANDSRFALIPPGVDLTVFDRNTISTSEEDTIQYLRAMLERDLRKDRLDLPCLVASSRLDPKKNHLGLVQAYAADQELQQASNLVILTSGLNDPLNSPTSASSPEKEVLDPLLELISEADLQGKVAMFSVSGQTELGAAYRYFGRTGSVFVLPALHEPFGLAPLEAIAAGMPAVVTKFGGPSESLQDGQEKFGILVDPSDHKELSSAILGLVDNPTKWQKYAAAGYQRVRSTYNWESTARGYLTSLERAKTSAKNRHLLQIHPYFSDPNQGNDITPGKLRQLYLSYIKQPAWL